MKFHLKVFFLLLSLSLIACDKNDDAQNNPQTPTDGFTIQGQFYDTPNCYIEFSNSQDVIKLFFANGRMFDNNNQINGSTGAYLFSINTTNWVELIILASENPSIATPQYPHIQTGIPYEAAHNGSAIVHNETIESLSPPFMINGMEFGENKNEYPPNDPNFQVHKVGNTNPVLTLNAYNYNTNIQTGTINADYTFKDALGQTITGHYEGSIGILLN